MRPRNGCWASGGQHSVQDCQGKGQGTDGLVTAAVVASDGDRTARRVTHTHSSALRPPGYAYIEGWLSEHTRTEQLALLGQRPTTHNETTVHCLCPWYASQCSVFDRSTLSYLRPLQVDLAPARVPNARRSYTSSDSVIYRRVISCAPVCASQCVQPPRPD
eukprot:scaffold2986_cov406-Prasinococcus_capsulatus_cf.AAC.13